MFFSRNQDLSVVADFDGDNRQDEAFFAKTRGGYAVVVCLDDGKHAVRIRDLRHVTGYGIQAAPPGLYITTCGRGIGGGCYDQPAEVELANDAIEFRIYEKASILYYWDNGAFKKVWTSS